MLLRVSGPGAAAFLALLLASCGSPPETVSAGKPQRIVSLVPTVTEILFAIGAGDRVVGISDFDTYPPEALNRPRVGALVDPNLEQIFRLRPDLVMTYRSQALLEERLSAAGIAAHAFDSGSIEEILEEIRGIGDRVGSRDAADRLASEIGSSLDAIRNRPRTTRPKVLLVHSREAGTLGAFYTGGARSYFDELIEIAGGHNLFGDVEENAFQPALEEVLKRAPEVIVELLPSSESQTARISQRMADWQRLKMLPAVRDGRVHVLAGDYFMLVGPRLPRAARELADVISPP